MVSNGADSYKKNNNYNPCSIHRATSDVRRIPSIDFLVSNNPLDMGGVYNPGIDVLHVANAYFISVRIVF